MGGGGGGVWLCVCVGGSDLVQVASGAVYFLRHCVGCGLQVWEVEAVL